MKTYSVKEIFGPTAQGEGTYTGKPVLFLRFAGCNKWSGRDQDKAQSICSFCDTDFVGGEKLTAIEIAARLKSLSNVVDTVVISGGEPLLQLDNYLARYLFTNGFRLHVETNGSIEVDFELKELIAHISCSPKQNLEQTKIGLVDDLKILYPPIHPEITPEHFMDYPCARGKFLQPVEGGPDYKNNIKLTLEKLFELGSEWSLSFQLHKYLEIK